jgi:GNAT superfamily N-acetyltransferase
VLCEEAGQLPQGHRGYDRQVSAASFSPVPESEQASAIATLVSAFTDDPVERWLWPETQAYLTHFPKFVAAFAGQAFQDETVWMLGDFSAVALWLAPGSEPDAEAIVNALSEGVSSEKHQDSFAVLEQMDQSHPEYPHWYLPWLGVNRATQGGGLGGELLKRCLAAVDESHLPTYLETPNPRTVPLYERHGFQIIDVAQAGACPPITLMLRAAQQS